MIRYTISLTMEELCAVEYALRARIAKLEQRVAQHTAADDQREAEDNRYLLDWTRSALRQITAEGL